MTYRRLYLDAAIRKDDGLPPAGEPRSAAENSADSRRQCAYNQTRGRFLGANVVPADSSIANLDTLLPTLAPNSGAGLWLLPFRGISPTNVRVPIDLIYLDWHCKVIATAESFPISPFSASDPSAASVLVLSAGTIHSTETRAGDQLILCPPEEMKQRLQQIAEAKPEPASPPAKEESARGSAFRVLQWEGRGSLTAPTETDLPMDQAREELPAGPAFSPQKPQPAPLIETIASQPAAIETGPKSAKPARSWLQRLLALDSPPPRKAARESLPGLAAYFFTGGTPEAYGVRDISMSGMYVFTSERWYPGTMVRVTLTDRHEPTVERSLTLNMIVARCGDDGVGFHFILRNHKSRAQASGMADDVDKIQMEQFLQRIRNTQR